MDTKISGYDLFAALIIALILSILETSGQTLLRKFYLENKNNNLSKYKNLYFPLLTWCLYGLCVLSLYFSYFYVDEGLIEVFWNTGTNTIIPLAGAYFYGENLSPMGWFGVVVTTVGGAILGLSQLK